jgi:hypothetical protein
MKTRNWVTHPDKNADAANKAPRPVYPVYLPGPTLCDKCGRIAARYLDIGTSGHEQTKCGACHWAITLIRVSRPQLSAQWSLALFSAKKSRNTLRKQLKYCQTPLGHNTYPIS